MTRPDTVTSVCGRYALARTTDDLVRQYDIDQVDFDDPTPFDYNVAPTRPVPVVTAQEDGSRVLRLASWGLVPFWAQDRSGASRMINARAETVAQKPAYRAALARRRCLVPADGWFEWAPPREGTGTARRPHYITPLDGSVLTFAGLYELWGTAPDLLLTCTIITTEARGALADIHRRMPVVLEPRSWPDWLDPRRGAAAPPEPGDAVLAGLELREVGPAVGNVRNVGPSLIEPLAARAEPEQPVQQVLY